MKKIKVVEVSTEKTSELIKQFVDLGHPDIAYSIYRLPHEPDKLESYNRDTKRAIMNYMNDYRKFLKTVHNKDEQGEFLEKNKDIGEFLITHKDIIDEMTNIRASRDIYTSEEQETIIDKTIEELLASIKTINDFKNQELGREDLVTVLAYELYSPELAYTVERLDCEITEEELNKKENRAIILRAVVEMLAYIDMFSRAIMDKKEAPLKAYLKDKKSLAEFIQKNGASIIKLFSKQLKDKQLETASKIVLTDLDR